jgi:hypothetical protein
MWRLALVIKRMLNAAMARNTFLCFFVFEWVGRNCVQNRKQRHLQSHFERRVGVAGQLRGCGTIKEAISPAHKSNYPINETKQNETGTFEPYATTMKFDLKFLLAFSVVLSYTQGAAACGGADHRHLQEQSLQVDSSQPLTRQHFACGTEVSHMEKVEMARTAAAWNKGHLAHGHRTLVHQNSTVHQNTTGPMKNTVHQNTTGTTGQQNYTVRQNNTVYLNNTVQQNYTIPVYFHVLQYNETYGGLSNRSIVNGFLPVLNKAYQNTPFRFELQQITKTINKKYYNCEKGRIESVFKSELRVGDQSYLNVYICNPNRLGLNGWSSYPPSVDYALFYDGVVMQNPEVPGASRIESFYSLVHEVGHFLGLLHTFEGGCSAAPYYYLEGLTIVGDGVHDTPGKSSVQNQTMRVYRPISTHETYSAYQHTRGLLPTNLGMKYAGIFNHLLILAQICPESTPA